MTAEGREKKEEQEAVEVLSAYDKGQISATVRDGMLRRLGYDYVGSQAGRKPGSGRRFRIGAKG